MTPENEVEPSGAVVSFFVGDQRGGKFLVAAAGGGQGRELAGVGQILARADGENVNIALSAEALSSFDPLVLSVVGGEEGVGAEAIDAGGPEVGRLDFFDGHGMVGCPTLIHLTKLDREGLVFRSGLNHEEGVGRVPGADFRIGVFEEEEALGLF